MDVDALQKLPQDLPSLRELGSDLAKLSVKMRFASLLTPLFCFGLYWFFAWKEFWGMAVACVIALSFFSYGSTSHDLVHHNLQLTPRLNHFLLSFIESLCLRSGTAYQITHLHHHRRFPKSDDVEARALQNSLWRAILFSPLNQIVLWLWAWKHHPKSRRQLALEAFLISIFISVAIFTWDYHPMTLVYVLLIIAGSWVIPLITVLIPHDIHAKTSLTQTRLFRGKFLPWIFLHHLYHLEHHLYPQVPAYHWRQLAKRLDPYFKQHNLQPSPLFKFFS